MKVLLVEDDPGFAAVVATSLRRQNYTVELAEDGEVGWSFLESMPPDVAIIDIDLPKLDGISLCQRLRRHGITTPVLLLTAHEADQEKVRGLDSGADDYLVKPCSLSELSARLRALLRRQQQTPAETILTWGDLSLDPARCEVVYAGRTVNLRPKEYSILELLIRNGQRVFSRTAILDHVWTIDDSPNENTIKAHIKGLRRNLQATAAPADIIESVYGLGYRMNPAFAQAHMAEAGTIATTAAPDEADLWALVQLQVDAQHQVLTTAIATLNQSSLSQTLRESARQAAHKLAGSLGTAGRPEGTEAARYLERFFDGKENDMTAAEQAVADLGRLISLPEGEASTTIYILGAADWAAPLYDNKPRAVQVVQTESVTPIILAEPSQTVVLVSEAATLASLPQPLPPTLIVQAQSSLNDTLAAKRAGALGVLVPPLSVAKVLATVQRSQQAQQPGDLHLLMVDDDPVFLMAVSSMLQPWGFRLTLLDHPRQAWEVLAEQKPDGILLDVDMPEFSGIELCEAIRNDDRYWEIPIWILTSHRDSETIQAVFEAGADDYIAKPVFAPELLARILNRLTRYARLRAASDKSR